MIVTAIIFVEPSIAMTSRREAIGQLIINANAEEVSPLEKLPERELDSLPAEQTNLADAKQRRCETFEQQLIVLVGVGSNLRAF